MRRQSDGVRRADEIFGPAPTINLSMNPETAIAVLEPLVTDERRARLLEVIGRRLDSVTVVMDAPHDPHNGGAVVRSCDAFGVQRLHVIERYEPFLVATSVAKGSEQWVDVRLYENAGRRSRATRLERARVHRHRSRRRAIARRPAAHRAPGAGHRQRTGGHRTVLRRLCTRAVRVPMRGFVDSLNLSVCTAILLAAAVEGRQGTCPTPSAAGSTLAASI